MKMMSMASLAMILFAIGGCQDDRKRKKDLLVAPPTVIQPPKPPVMALGTNQDLSAGSVAWSLPDFLKGQFADLNKANAEAALDLDMTNGTDREIARVNTGFTVKACEPAIETAAFVTAVARQARANAPASHQLDVEEVMSWTSEAKTFKGRLFLKKAYKAEGDTGVYRIDALVTNLNASECVLWNFVFTPKDGTTAGFIEGSAGYKELMTSLGVTWEGLGAKFND